MGNFKNEFTIVQSLPPASRTAVGDGTGVDLQGYDEAVVLIDCGTISGGTFTFEVQESDSSGSGYTAVADADLDGTEPVIDTPNDDQIHRIGYRGRKRYIRVSITAEGSTATLICSASVMRVRGRVRP